MNRQSDPIELFRPDPNGKCLCGKKKPFKNCCGRVSDNRSPPEGMILKRGFLRADTCDKLITYADKQSEGSLKVRKKLSNSEETFEEVDPLRVASRVNLGDKQKVIDTWIDDIFYKFLAKKVKQKIRSFEVPQLMKYTAGGFYKPHSDAELFDDEKRQWYRVFDRDYSLLLYLNDDFRGGAVEFTYFNYTFEPKKGDLLIFPSNYLFLHEAKKVESGVRYVIVSWAATQ